jgi:glycosyltransferase involved in cell wall biosynthesis
MIMGKKIDISVIVTNYNKGKLLYQCLNSIKKQSYRNFSVVVIDDSSSDNLSKNCFYRCKKEYSKDARFLFIENELNLGASEAVNRAIKASSGDLIMLLDADDTFPPSAIQSVKNVASEKPDRHIYFGDYLVSNEVISCKYIESEIHGYIDKKKLAEQYKLLGTSPFSREIWELCGGFNSKIKMLNDMDFFLRAIDSQKQIGAYIPEVIYNWNIAAGDKSTFCSRAQISMMFFKHIKFYLKNMGKKRLIKELFCNAIAIPLDKLHLFPIFHWCYSLFRRSK